MLTKKLSQTLTRDYFFVIFAWSLRQRVHLHHETFWTNSSLEKGGMSIETAWCVAWHLDQSQDGSKSKCAETRK